MPHAGSLARAPSKPRQTARQTDTHRAPKLAFLVHGHADALVRKERLVLELQGHGLVPSHFLLHLVAACHLRLMTQLLVYILMASL